MKYLKLFENKTIDEILYEIENILLDIKDNGCNIEHDIKLLRGGTIKSPKSVQQIILKINKQDAPGYFIDWSDSIYHLLSYVTSLGFSHTIKLIGIFGSEIEIVNINEFSEIRIQSLHLSSIYILLQRKIDF